MSMWFNLLRVEKKVLKIQAEKYKKERAIKEEREKRANEKWNRIKANFEGMVFKRNDELTRIMTRSLTLF